MHLVSEEPVSNQIAACARASLHGGAQLEKELFVCVLQNITGKKSKLVDTFKTAESVREKKHKCCF